MIALYCTLLGLAADAKRRVTREETGATAVEYGLMVGLIAVVIIGAVTALGTQLEGSFVDIVTSLGGTVE